MSKKLIIQITDMHLFENADETLLGVNTWNSFDAVVDSIQRNYPNPDLIVLTGDLAQDETARAYQKLIRRLHVFNCPKYGIPGNHDDEKYLISTFRDFHLQDNRNFRVGDWHFIMLNTQKKHAVEGYLTDEQLDFLNHSLGSYPEHPTLIFMHHPPVPVGSAWIDKLNLSNPDAFWSVLKSYHSIKGIFCGHVHQEFMSTQKGIPVFTTPSTCFQFANNTEHFAVSYDMPGFRVIEVDDVTLTTKVHRISGFDLNIDTSSEGY